VSLIGAECTGKSTLAGEMASMLDGAVVPEVLRDFVSGHGRAPHRDEQEGIAAAQRGAEIAALREHRWVVADPAPFMTAVYSVVYFADEELLPRTTHWLRQARLIVWCRPDVPWVADAGQRDGPTLRTAVDDELGRRVAELRRAGLVVHEAAGPRERRLAGVRVALQESGVLGNLDS